MQWLMIAAMEGPDWEDADVVWKTSCADGQRPVVPGMEYVPQM